jgi:hypothetical protein
LAHRTQNAPSDHVISRPSIDFLAGITRFHPQSRHISSPGPDLCPPTWSLHNMQTSIDPTHHAPLRLGSGERRRRPEVPVPDSQRAAPGRARHKRKLPRILHRLTYAFSTLVQAHGIPWLLWLGSGDVLFLLIQFVDFEGSRFSLWAIVRSSVFCSAASSAAGWGRQNVCADKLWCILVQYG